MTVTVDLTPQQVAQLDRLAAATGRGTGELMQEAIDNLLAYNDWFKEQIQVGLEQANRGELLEDTEVQARIARMFQS